MVVKSAGVKPLDLQVRFRRHVNASIQRDKWAYKAKELMEAGKIREARQALKKAEAWDFRRRELEL